MAAATFQPSSVGSLAWSDLRQPAARRAHQREAPCKGPAAGVQSGPYRS